MKTKKGLSLNQAPMAVMMIVFIGLIAVVGITINTQLRDSSWTSATHNETIAIANNTATSLAFPRALSISSLGNVTYTVGSANYTLASTESTSTVTVVYSDSAGVWASGNYWVVYEYKNIDSAYSAADNSTKGIQNITDQLSLIGLIIIMSIVIGILWTSFGGMFRSSGGGI